MHWGEKLLRGKSYLLGSSPMAASRRGLTAPAHTATGIAPDSHRISSFRPLRKTAEHDAAYLVGEVNIAPLFLSCQALGENFSCIVFALVVG